MNSNLSNEHDDNDIAAREAVVVEEEQVPVENNKSIELVDFEDGHYPGLTDVKTKIAIYSHKHSAHFLSIFDDLLSSEWCDKAYQYAVDKGKPWGNYIQTADVCNSSITSESLWSNNEYEKAIALHAVRRLLLDRGSSTVGNDIDMIHGTAVWCLTSNQTYSVQYHIDYAELYRYETNIIYPPLYAGTCHVSPIHGSNDMIGGSFCANIGGIDHYRRFGYKGKLSNPADFKDDLNNSSDWITIPYKRNRGILHDGNYPHLSTAIEYIRPDYKRVIIGFNCFTKELSECNIRAPEHSDAFNRTIKLYQMMSSIGLPITTTSPVTTTISSDESDENDNMIHYKHSSSCGAKYDNSNKSSNFNTTASDEHDDVSNSNNGDTCDLVYNLHADECSNLSNSFCSTTSSSEAVGNNTSTHITRSVEHTISSSSSSNGAGSNGGINVRDVMKNPALKRLLLMAAKKIKEQQQTAVGATCQP